MNKRLLVSFLIVSLSLCWQLGEARGGKKRPVKSFDGIDTLFAFEIEGVSLNTPSDDIAGILEANGYTLYSDVGSTLIFTKGALGPGNLGIKGEAGYVMQLTQNEMQRSIYFYRPPFPMNLKELRAAKPTPIQDTIDAQVGTALMALICENVTDPKERHQLCKPSTETEIGFGERLALELRKSPVVTASVVIRGNTGHISITSYK